MLQGTHTRETRDGARELKFLVTADQAAQILAWARTRLDADPHAGGPTGDQYRTTTIYLDTEARDVFHRRGSYGRSKFRIRRYGASDVTFLERKLRTSRLLNKRRATVATGQLPALFDTQTDARTIRWFLDRVAHRRLGPVCQVSYRRHALIGTTPAGPLRLTFDDDIRVQPNDTTAFAPDGGLSVLAGQVIIEMKYCITMPTVLRELVERFHLVPSAISKYRTSLGELAAVAETARRHAADPFRGLLGSGVEDRTLMGATGA